MTLKMVTAPVTFVSLVLLLIYMQPHVLCVVIELAKHAGNVTL
jgi:hypothetical protein